jgi:transcriptional regulator with XRE-family HTH domain
MDMEVKRQFLVALGRHLKIQRDKTGKSPKQIAALLGISATAYRNLERGESDICASKLLLLAGQYNITMDELLPSSLAVHLTAPEVKPLLAKKSFEPLKAVS